MKMYLIAILLWSGSALSDTLESNDALATDLLRQLLQEKNWSTHQVEILNALLLEKSQASELGLPQDISSLMNLGMSLNQEVSFLTKNLAQQIAKAKENRRQQRAQLLAVSPEFIVAKTHGEIKEKMRRQENVLRVLRARSEELTPTQKQQLATLSRDQAAAFKILQDSTQTK